MMKNLKKYTKWSVAACMVFSASVFTACNDDDDVVIQVPDQFKMELSNLNIAWDETEGFVQFDADKNWKVESTSPWISVDPSKGAPGSYRTYFIFEPNPYRLNRTGDVNVTCGDQQAVVHITQAGCTDDSKIPPMTVNMEIPSFDYQTEEIPFSTFSESIMGNMGLTIAQFGQGVDDDGDLDFFMVAKDGSWYKGGTSGTRCGAWLDANQNVVNWDPDGYPAIATFIEVYGGDDPVLVVGRAPGVPDNAEYTLNFGFVTADRTKYQLFSVNVVFPAADLKGTVVGTFDLNYSAPATDDYSSGACVFDAKEVAALLGASSISLAKVVAYDADGEFVGYTANNGYWFTKTGQIGSWGENAGWFIEYYGNDAEATEEDLTSWWIGNMPGVDAASGVSKIGFWYNGNVVMFNIHVTIGEGGSEVPPQEDPTPDAGVNVVKTIDLTASKAYSSDYASVPVKFDVDEVLSLLGCSLCSDLKVVSYDKDGNALNQTGNGGYWYNAQGEVDGWGNGAWYVEYYGNDKDAEPEDFDTFWMGNHPQAQTANGTCSIALEYNGKAVVFNIHVVVTE